MKTNYDVVIDEIKNMTVEELASMINASPDINGCTRCAYSIHPDCTNYGYCTDGIALWLKQEAKKMTIEEWKKTASPEAVEQYDRPFGWFKENVKCCYNCKNWEVDPELVFEYRYNFCNRLCKGGKNRMTVADGWCKSYQGNCTVENLLDYLEVKDEA